MLCLYINSRIGLDGYKSLHWTNVYIINPEILLRLSYF